MTNIREEILNIAGSHMTFFVGNRGLIFATRLKYDMFFHLVKIKFSDENQVL